MVTKAEINLIRSLNKKRERDETGLFVVEGEKMVDELITAGWEIKLLLKRDEIGEEMMSRISHLSSPSPVLAVVKKPLSHRVIHPLKKGLYLALEAIKDPGNMGTIIRIADWFKIDTIFCSEDCVDIYNSKVVQSSMGSLFRTKLEYTSLERLVIENKGSIDIFGTCLEGDNIYSSSLPDSAIIIMGSESFGISDSLSSLINKRLTIPAFNKEGAESLNVAVATAIVCSEFRRSFASGFQKG